MCDVIRDDLSLPAVVKAMVSRDMSWDAVSSFCDAVVLEESAERVREASSELAIRRKRLGCQRAVSLGKVITYSCTPLRLSPDGGSP